MECGGSRYSEQKLVGVEGGVEVVLSESVEERDVKDKAVGGRVMRMAAVLSGVGVSLSGCSEVSDSIVVMPKVVKREDDWNISLNGCKIEIVNCDVRMSAE